MDRDTGTAQPTMAFHVALAACLVLLVMFFHQDAGTNANSRLLLVFALVEDGTHAADRWADITVDKAIIDGHAYCEKAPLAGYLVVPFFWLWRLRGGPISPLDAKVAYHLADVLTGALPLALLATLTLTRLHRTTGRTDARHVWLVSAVLFGTFAAVYASTYFAHCLGGILIVGSYILAVERGRRLALAGLLAGCAGITEYPLILPAAVMAVSLLIRPPCRRALLRYLLGAAPAAGLLFAYNAAITGSPWEFPYKYAAGFPEMGRHVGLGLPSISALWGLLFSLHRGAFVYAPVLWLLVPLLTLRFDGPGRRRNVVVACLLAHLLLLSSYAVWDGGWAVGPRLLTAVVMLALYEGCAAAAGRPRWIPACLALGLIGLLINHAAGATDPMFDSAFKNPLVDWIWPRLRHNAINPQNIPAELGLPNGLYLAAAWLACWAATTWAFARWYAQTVRTGDGRGNPDLNDRA